ncbi:MAG: methylenetetrahydrofolate reductase C-terminal domain-containing protein [Chloroflexota bacterium]
MSPTRKSAETASAPAIAPSTGPGALRKALFDPQGWATVVELVPWAGELADAKGATQLKAAQDLAGNPRITAMSITDNAGGHAKLSPSTLGAEVQALGHDAIVHVACRDRSRNALQSLGWELLSRGLTSVLALTGDYPESGYEGLSRPVFDIDSVALLFMYRNLGKEAVEKALAADAEADPNQHRFLLGCAIDPYKRVERDLVPQYLKLGLKVRSGADYAIAQVGYDARKLAELLAVIARDKLDIPAVANAYILSAPVARAFNAGKVPGCIVTDDLLAVAEQQAKSPDKGRAFFLEFAAKQAIVAKGLGFKGVYFSGHRNAGEIAKIFELIDAHPADDWRSLLKDVSWGLPAAFHLFERDQDGLPTGEPAKAYARSLTPAARKVARAKVDPLYKFSRIVHERVFEPGTPGFNAWGKVFEKIEQYHLDKPAQAFEQAVKIPMFDCRDCGDCSLPDIAYLCPESHCQKNQRNGPCGGAHDGLCEVPGHTCIWADAYKRLKPYGEELTMLDRAPVLQDNALRRTSAWGNAFLDRDHIAKRNGRLQLPVVEAPKPKPAVAPPAAAAEAPKPDAPKADAPAPGPDAPK